MTCLHPTFTLVDVSALDMVLQQAIMLQAAQ